jgi:hypothetical protein
MREKFAPFISFTAPRQIRLPGQSLRRAAGHRSGALFFALYRDDFIVTRSFAAVYLDLVPTRSFTVALSYSAVYLDWRKNAAPRSASWRNGT